MTNITALVREWLAHNLGVATLVEDRVATVLDPADGYPALVIGPVTGAPRSTASKGVDVVEDWNVALYCYGGTISSGKSDLPDSQAAWAVAEAVVAAAAEVTSSHYDSDYGYIVAARVVSASPTAVDPDTRSARATVTLTLQVWQ